MATRASDEEDRRRELVLNWILLALVVLAIEEAATRAPSVLEGGAAASDHGPTLILALVSAFTFTGLFVASRRGKQVRAAWGLMIAYFAIIAWLFVAEGTEESAAIVLCTTMVVTGGVLMGTRVAVGAAVLLSATMIPIGALQHAKVLSVPAGHDTPDVLSLLAICGGLGVLALVLSARTGEREAPVGELLDVARGGTSEPSRDSPIGALSVRELQIVGLIANGKSNEQIAQELFLSPRTVSTHVSNALRKTGCTNRTELAVLAIHSDAVAPG